jgi:hypothetical protein
MASDGSNRGGLLTAGGILSIIAGAFEIIFGAVMVGWMVGGLMWDRFHPFPPMPWMPGGWPLHIVPLLGILGVPIFALGIVAIVGGVSAIRRKSFGLSLAGAICALPSVILGILAIIFVSLAKREFKAES